MKKLLYLFLFICSAGYAQTPGKLIYSDDFSKPLDSKTWISEIEPKPDAVSKVYTKNNSLILDTKGGVTVWLNKELKGNIQIEYDRQVLVDTGKNDRLSDFNQFWMATDPHNANLFTRSGKFEAYDNLVLYYVGMGGNTNKTTRFRKYLVNGTKPIIKEYLDEPHRLKANKVYHIKTIVNKGITSFWVDGECYFTYTDPEPLTSGYFGFRCTWSRQEIKNLKVYQLKD
jgi:rhamnogalacturonan endolyase